MVGIRNPLPLTDGGQLFRPEFAPYAKDGKDWVIEGHGVDPDIVVDNDPAKEFNGEDQQLDRAIEEDSEGYEDQGLRSAAGPALSKSEPDAANKVIRFGTIGVSSRAAKAARERRKLRCREERDAI